MSVDNIPTRQNGQYIDSSWFNIWRKVFISLFVPRNTSGQPTANAGGLGTSTYKFERMHIASGHLHLGMIKYKYDYNGTVSIEPGWFPCDGTVINETNYDAIHGAGKWDADIVTSPLDGKYSPDLDEVFLVSTTGDTEDGAAPISTVGLSANTVNLQHNHVGSIANNAVSGVNPTLAYAETNTIANVPHNHTVSIANELSAAQDITPELIRAKAYMRII
jgi:hypothetical protein